MLGRLHMADPNAEEEKRQRRRLQNKINQRTRRQRLQETAPASQTANRPYRVGRWRINHKELTESVKSGTILQEGSPDVKPPSCEAVKSPPEKAIATTNITILACAHMSKHTDTSQDQPEELTPLSADHHLLHLIHLNVSRGLRQTKTFLLRFTSYYIPGYTTSSQAPLITEVHPDVLFYGSSLIATSRNDFLPQTLAPTKAQMSLVHATWINALPFPRMRENLIRWEDSFDHAEFMQDLVGDLVDTRPLLSTRSATSVSLTMPRSESRFTLSDSSDDDGVTANRNGLIVWGEPYKVESWELTPGFLRKWMWTVEGCAELIASSNHWRRVRGEEPLIFGCMD